MDPVVTVDSDNVTVEPGGQASVTVRVRNLSSIVEGFRLDVVGDAAGWTQVLPDHVEVLPQGEAQVLVLFSPPAGTATRAGQIAFGVRAVSQVDPESSAVTEGDLHVGAVSQSQATISPVTSKGRFSAKHRLEFSNWGNEPLRLGLEVSDPDEALGFLLTPDVLDLPLGTTATARLKVRARKPFFRGTPLRRAFRVVGRPVAPDERVPGPGPAPAPYGYDPTQPAVDAAFEQRPILGRPVVPLAVLAVVAAGAIGLITSRSGDDPAAESVPPPTPTGFAATALKHDAVRLTWQPGDRVDGYTLLTIDPATRDQPEPRVIVESPEPIPGSQGQFDVPGLTPNTESCYQLVAIRGDAESAATAPACATTKTLGGPTAPPAPTDVTVAAAGEGKAIVSWTDSSDRAANHNVLRDGKVVAVVEAPLSEQEVTLVEGENCFQVQAVQGEAVSEPSAEQCVQSDSGGGPAGGDLGVVAVPYMSLVEDPESVALVEQERADLLALGITAVVLNTNDYPDLQPSVAKAFLLVAVPNFDSEEEAQAFCQERAFTCQIYTPGRPRPAASTTTTTTTVPEVTTVPTTQP